MRSVLARDPPGVRRTSRWSAAPGTCPRWPARSAVKDDAALLKGRRKVKVEFTWVPWTYGRLASWSGYGAGVRSPGWYHHLFSTADEVVPRWLVNAAGVLRAEGVPTSSAHVIEATRLAEALATLRGRPLAGLAEVTEAAEAVMCDGDDAADRTDRPRARGRRAARRGARGDAGGAAGARPGGTAARRAAQARGAGSRAGAGPATGDRPRPQPAAAPAAGARRVVGPAGGRPARHRHVPGDVATALAAGVRGPPGRGAACTAPRWWRPRAPRSPGAPAGPATLAEVTALVEACLLADLTDAYPAVLAALDTRAALDADVNHLWPRSRRSPARCGTATSGAPTWPVCPL